MASPLCLYHGSKACLSGPIRPISRSACDFGRGFYMGSCRQITITASLAIGPGECEKLQRRSDLQRRRAAAIVDRIMDENRRDGLLFTELLEREVERIK